MSGCLLVLILLLFLAPYGSCLTQSETRREAEYYVNAYARHYQISVEFVRALIEQESGWHDCAVSPKGAIGLMQLMPATAARLKVRNRCDLNQNVSGGVRYLAWLMGRFHGDLRLVAAAYYAGEGVIGRRGLYASNPGTVKYVAAIRRRVELERKVFDEGQKPVCRRRKR
jgi:soluble lytic murein transglycosylase-like protein